MLFRFMRFSERSGHGKPLFGAWYDAGTKNGFFHTKCGLRTLWALRSVDPLYSRTGVATFWNARYFKIHNYLKMWRSFAMAGQKL